LSKRKQQAELEQLSLTEKPKISEKSKKLLAKNPLYINDRVDSVTRLYGRGLQKNNS
jgi:hypothetical protein